MVLERRSRAYVLSRIRAGVLEQGLADMLRAAKVGARMDREGKVHEGFTISYGDDALRIDLAGPTGGKTVMVYGQTEVTRDLYEARDEMGDGKIEFTMSKDVTPDKRRFDTDTSVCLTYSVGRRRRAGWSVISSRAVMDFTASAGRPFRRRCVRREYEKVYPFGWLGILSETPPVNHELIYANSGERGFRALFDAQSDKLSRYYIQVLAQ